MTQALAERPTAAVVTADQLELVKRTVAQGATDAELKLYLYDCQRQGVHPLDRLLHFTKRGGKYTPVTSIDLMRIRAAETGDYAGNEDAYFTGTPMAPDFTARVSVYRLVQNQRCEFVATARWSEYFPGEQSGHMWKKMPHTMLAKCAEALALRKGFPRQLAGLYASEELDQADRPPSSSTATRPALPRAGSATDAELGAPAASVPDSPQIPAPPPGWRYIDEYWEEGGWHHVKFLHFDAQNGAMEFKTKKGDIGNDAERAYKEHIPVVVETRGPWLNSVNLLPPDYDTPHADPEPPDWNDIKDSDIPFDQGGSR